MTFSQSITTVKLIFLTAVKFYALLEYQRGIQFGNFFAQFFLKKIDQSESTTFRFRDIAVQISS